jgi:hypothetical protein
MHLDANSKMLPGEIEAGIYSKLGCWIGGYKTATKNIWGMGLTRLIANRAAGPNRSCQAWRRWARCLVEAPQVVNNGVPLF